MAEPINAIRTLQTKDVVSSKLANAYITVDGKRYLLFQAKKLEATVEKNKEDVYILGRPMAGSRATGMSGKGTLTIYYNTSLFTKMMLNYKRTGEDTFFDIQTTNYDPASASGKQTIILKNCNLDSLPIGAFDAEGSWLEQEIPFTFDDFEVPEEFAELDGMSVG